MSFLTLNSLNNPNTEDELLQLETLPGPLLVDNMQNEASKTYGSFPDRLYIVLDGIVVYQVRRETVLAR